MKVERICTYSDDDDFREVDDIRYRRRKVIGKVSEGTETEIDRLALDDV